MEIGELFDGKYKILAQIGQGGMSKVYLALNERANKQWAVKEINKNSGNAHYNEIMLLSIITETDLIKRLNHPSLPQIIDIIDKEDALYIVMEYIEGRALNSILEKEGPLPEQMVVDCALQLCEVLSYLHTQTPPIIYRDMKPGNIMLRADGTIKLIDFGTAREFKTDRIADTATLGTVGYAAPEQFGGMGQTDVRTDIYGLGATLYHLVTGKNPAEPPFEIYPIRHWNPQLSVGLEKIILKCTRQNPNERYQTCQEVIYALNHYEHIAKYYPANVIASGIQSLKKRLMGSPKSYVNQDKLSHKNDSSDIEQARYFAGIITGTQKDEKNCSKIEGPTYDEQ